MTVSLAMRSTTAGRGIYDAAPAPKRSVLVPNARHNDLELPAVRAFVQDLPGYS